MKTYFDYALKHFEVGAECWNWTGGRQANGYGQLTVDDRKGFRAKSLRAHRIVYEALVGPIPEGLQLDHLCRNRRCVRPSHLEAVTGRENKMRGSAENYVIHKRGICKYGHPIQPYVPCRECGNRRSREWARAHRRNS